MEERLRLSSTLFSSYFFKREGEEILERGEAPLLPALPPSPSKGRGSGG